MSSNQHTLMLPGMLVYAFSRRERYTHGFSLFAHARRLVAVHGRFNPYTISTCIVGDAHAAPGLGNQLVAARAIWFTGSAVT